jgi:ribosomal protein L37AE/L43A
MKDKILISRHSSICSGHINRISKKNGVEIYKCKKCKVEFKK